MVDTSQQRIYDTVVEGLDEEGEGEKKIKDLYEIQTFQRFCIKCTNPRDRDLWS